MSGASAGGAARLLELLRTLSFERKRVVLASGRESDFFVDCKQTILTAEGHALVGELMLAALTDYAPCEAVAGVELGGCPLASAVSLTSFLQARAADVAAGVTAGGAFGGHASGGALGLPALYVRKQQKDHGSRRLVEGDRALRPGLPVVLLEDVVTTGGSSLAAVASLGQAGARVVGILALVDRLEGGAATIAAAGVPFRALYTRRDFIPD
jgi:orotate phosphoribosyltransferase